MKQNNILKAPTGKQKLVLRLMILIGVFCILNFFYRFLNPGLVDNGFLFSLLICVVIFDTFRLLYIWYHYWNITIPEKPTLTKSFTVDVLTTYFPGEPIEMVVETLLAIKKINYPHTTYLCDEANDHFLKQFCKEHGFIHVTRDNRFDAKAGNINNALQQASGDLCLILDPDHIPQEDFIDAVLPYFEDDKIGFVQTVQAYYNINESKVAKGAAQQTFHFYGPLMMGMQSYGTVNAIGANCVFRRAALDSIGGHAAGLSEDMHTAMQLHAAGWESVYVPKSFTKGLVPATLLSFYKQQLKWSKGTFELLVKVYPKLFRKFTWRQKLHYGILPLHYLSGVIFMFSFLIPIISLFGAVTPWKGNIIDFSLITIPILTSVICIRIYVQQWVVYKQERGMHVLGGMLFQVTWWVYIIGVIYTCIGKRVLYLPTLKSDQERTPFRIVLPNIIFGIISILSIVIGLRLDLTPFSITMAVFAFWNALLLFFTLIFAYESRQSFYFSDYLEEQKQKIQSKLIDTSFYAASKSMLVLLIGVLVLCTYVYFQKQSLKENGLVLNEPAKVNLNYLGLFYPKKDNGITDLKKIQKTEDHIGENINIVSFYYPWKEQIDKNFSSTTLDSVYTKDAIPMVTWEPWLNDFKKDSLDQKHVFDLINEGFFDDYLHNVALQFKGLEKPVFLRFAHEFDNPFYPWYDKRENASVVFKKAWIRVHNIFKETQANNVIWVWNPWKPEHISSYFPGDNYVDWVSVNILNYSNKSQPKENFSFKQLYDSYHNNILELPNKPVMISEFGVLKNNVNQEEWILQAFEVIKKEFNEIQAVIYFNSKVDNNVPEEDVDKEKILDWSVSDNSNFYAKNFKAEKATTINLLNYSSPKGNDTLKVMPSNNVLKNIKGINFKKGENWNNDYHILNRKNLEFDFNELKKIGINTIRYKENKVYDYNVINISKEFNLNICYGFHIPADIDFVNDSLILEKIEDKILKKVVDYRHTENIIAWDFQNDVLNQQYNYYYKPELLIQRQAYLSWLNNLLVKLNKLDGQRPILLSLEVGQKTVQNIVDLNEFINGCITLGLVIDNKAFLEPVQSKMDSLNLEYVFTDINLELYQDLESKRDNNAFFLTSWQNQHEMNRVSLSGLIDRKSRFKTDYFRCKSFLKFGIKDVEDSLKVNILKPAKLTYDHSILLYTALVFNPKSGWVIPETTDYDIEWELIKMDKYGNNLTIREVGNDVELYLNIPKQSEHYKLQLSIIVEDRVYTYITSLNTPYFAVNK